MGKQKQHLRCRTKIEPYLFCSFWHVLANNILKMALKDKACHTNSEPAKKEKEKTGDTKSHVCRRMGRNLPCW